MIVAPRDPNATPAFPGMPVAAMPATAPAQTPPAKPARWNRADAAAEASIETPLKRGQVTALVILAKQAWTSLRQVRDDVPDFETWRQAEAVKACGHRISFALVKHFSALKRHFANIAGDSGKAFNSAMREGTEDKRIAMAKLAEACQERGLEMSYPAAICRRQFKRSLEDASAKQTWCLVFTVRNRRKVGDAAPQAKATAKPAAPSAGGGRQYTVKRGASAKKYTPPVAADSDSDLNPF